MFKYKYLCKYTIIFLLRSGLVHKKINKNKIKLYFLIFINF